jgi:hypothetical protein
MSQFIIKSVKIPRGCADIELPAGFGLAIAALELLVTGFRYSASGNMFSFCEGSFS